MAFGLLQPFVAATSVHEVVADRWQIGAVVLHGCVTLFLALAVALILHAGQGVLRQSLAWVRHCPSDTGMSQHNRKAQYKGLMAPLTESKRRDNTPYVVPLPHETKSAALTWPKNGPLPPRSIRISP